MTNRPTRLDRRALYDEWTASVDGVVRCPWCQQTFMANHPGQRVFVRRHPLGLHRPPTADGHLSFRHKDCGTQLEIRFEPMPLPHAA